MLLTVIWVLEASLGLFGAVLVLADSLAIYRGLRVADAGVALRFRVDILRDILILTGQVINVLIGLIGAIVAGHAQDGFTNLLNALTIGGLMAAPLLLGIISYSTFRSRRR